MLYSIQIGNNTYVDWCDDKWYGTVTTPVHKFTMDEVKQIVQYLKTHFKYNVIISNTENEYYYSFGEETIKKPVFKIVEHPVITDDIDNDDEQVDAFIQKDTSVLDDVSFE